MNKNHRKGLLGAPTYSSSEDEDYRPRGSPQKNPSKRAHDSPDEQVPLANRRRTLLASEEARPSTTPTAITPSTSRSQPSQDLPREVLHNILLFACQGKDGAVPIANVACCVSRSWRDAVHSCSSLWRTVDLSQGTCTLISSAKLIAQCPRWTELRSLSLGGCTNIKGAAFATVAASCPLIESLDLSDCTGFTAAGLADVLNVMILHPSGPETAPLRRLNLSRMELRPKNTGMDLVVKRVLMTQADHPEGPVLEELVVDGCPLLSHLPLRAVCEAGIRSTPPRPLLSALRVLSLANSCTARSGTAIHIDRLHFICPNLEVLDVRRFGGLYSWETNGAVGSELGEWAETAVRWRCLKSFSVEGVPLAQRAGTALNGRDVIRLMGDTCVLEDLHIGYCSSHLDTSTVVDVIERNPRLHTLALPYTSMGNYNNYEDYAGSFLKFVAAPPSLEVLDLTGTDKVLVLGKDVIHMLTRWPKLRILHAAGTGITTERLRTFLGSLRLQDRLEGFTIYIDSCRGVDREVRQAASLGMPQLFAALGVVPTEIL